MQRRHDLQCRPAAKPLHAVALRSKIAAKYGGHNTGTILEENVDAAEYSCCTVCSLRPLPGRYAQAPDASFNDTQKPGLRLFSQSCGVCHTMVQQRTKQYGPVLSRETLGGDEDLMREYISNGTPRMPGFRYNFEPDANQCHRSYIKTIPPQADACRRPMTVTSQNLQVHNPTR